MTNYLEMLSGFFFLNPCYLKPPNRSFYMKLFLDEWLSCVFPFVCSLYFLLFLQIETNTVNLFHYFPSFQSGSNKKYLIVTKWISFSCSHAFCSVRQNYDKSKGGNYVIEIIYQASNGRQPRQVQKNGQSWLLPFSFPPFISEESHCNRLFTLIFN